MILTYLNLHFYEDSTYSIEVNLLEVTLMFAIENINKTCKKHTVWIQKVRNLKMELETIFC